MAGQAVDVGNSGRHRGSPGRQGMEVQIAPFMNIFLVDSPRMFITLQDRVQGM